MLSKEDFKKYSLQYITALGLIAVISISYFIYINLEIRELREGSTVINTAGRQRMLSQRSVLLKRVLMDDSTNELVKSKFNAIVEQMNQEHQSLACDALEIQCDNEIHQEISVKLKRHIKVLLANDLSLIDSYTTQELDLFLELLDFRVKTFEKEVKRRNEDLIFAEEAILIFILLTLVLEAKFIFRPIFSSLFSAITALNKKDIENRELIKEKNKILDELSHDLKTPLNELSHVSSQLEAENKVKKELESSVNKIQNSINYFLNFHRKEKTPKFAYIKNKTIKKMLPEEVSESFHVVKGSDNFFKVDIFSLSSFITSAYYISKQYDLEFVVDFSSGLLLTLKGEETSLEQIESLLQEGGTFTDILHITFFNELKKYKSKVIFTANKVEISLIFESLPSRSSKQYFVKKALVVDDNSINQKILQRMLDKHEIEVRCVNSGEKALEAVEEGDFDVVFMDIRMPGISGIDAVKELRNRGKRIHIVMVSANSFYSDIKESILAGANSFVAKPVRPDLLVEEIEFASFYYGQKKILFS